MATQTEITASIQAVLDAVDKAVARAQAVVSSPTWASRFTDLVSSNNQISIWKAAAKRAVGYQQSLWATADRADAEPIYRKSWFATAQAVISELSDIGKGDLTLNDLLQELGSTIGQAAALVLSTAGTVITNTMAPLAPALSTVIWAALKPLAKEPIFWVGLAGAAVYFGYGPYMAFRRARKVAGLSGGDDVKRKTKKSKKGTTRVRCSYCGKMHYLRPDYLGYEKNALCRTCERQLYRSEE